MQKSENAKVLKSPCLPATVEAHAEAIDALLQYVFTIEESVDQTPEVMERTQYYVPDFETFGR